MESVARLVAEHELIERVLKLLETALAQIDAGEPVPAEFPAWAAEFFQQFADHCHHAKEEDVFFPLLKERGIPEQGGPLGVMLHEHVLGRVCVGRMRAAAAAVPCDVRQFADAARQYLPLLRQHIFKENHILFRMAEGVLSPTDDAALAAQFTQVEADRKLADFHARYARETAQWEAALN